MKQGVLPINIIIACFYLIIIGLVMYIFKKANNPFKNSNYTIKKIETKQDAQRLNYNKLIAKSWLKKYSFVGSILNDDKKYLLKEFVYLSSYIIACLKINKIIIWPICFTLFITPIIYICFQWFLKKIHKEKIQEQNGQQANKNAIKNQIQSQLQIHQNIIHQVVEVSSKTTNKSIKNERKINERTFIERLILGSLAFSSILMLMQTVYTLTNSISNSAQINITSIFIIFLLQQLAIRPSLGLIIFGVYKLYNHLKQPEQSLNENQWINLLCQEEIAEIIVQIEKEKIMKQKQRLNDSLRKADHSPTKAKKIQKNVLNNHEKSSYLNLIMQPTTKQPEQVVQQLFFTAMQKQLFEDEHKQQILSSMETKRRRINKENNHIICRTSAVIKHKQDEEDDIDEISIVKQQILKEHNNNFITQFDCNDEKNSPVHHTKRRNLAHRKNKRVLNLTGSSPYLEYLPDMLKKVDQYKQMHTNKQTSSTVKKIL